MKQNYDINATISDVLEPCSYFIKIFKNLGIKKYICSKNLPRYTRNRYTFFDFNRVGPAPHYIHLNENR